MCCAASDVRFGPIADICARHQVALEKPGVSSIQVSGVDHNQLETCNHFALIYWAQKNETIDIGWFCVGDVVAGDFHCAFIVGLCTTRWPEKI
jgi:hypothetical protein